MVLFVGWTGSSSSELHVASSSCSLLSLQVAPYSSRVRSSSAKNSSFHLTSSNCWHTMYWSKFKYISWLEGYSQTCSTSLVYSTTSSLSLDHGLYITNSSTQFCKGIITSYNHFQYNFEIIVQNSGLPEAFFDSIWAYNIPRLSYQSNCLEYIDRVG